MRSSNPLLTALALLCCASPALAQTPRFERLRGMLPFDFDPTRAVATGDVDGDGDADAVLTTAEEAQLLRNQGTGSFVLVPGSLPAPPSDFAQPFLADVDGDGDLDLLLLGASGQWLVNDGTGTFAPHPVALPAFPPAASSGAVADFDGDGDVDLLVGGFSACRLLLTGGSGAFVDASANLPAGPVSPHELLAGDVDGDGDVDVVIMPSSNAARLYVNGGTGTFTFGPDPAPGSIASLARGRLGDVDGDSDLDLVVANILGDRLLANDGSGNFTEVPGAIPPGQLVPNPAFPGSRLLELSDLDGDGDLDLFTKTWEVALGPGVTLVYINAGNGTFSELFGASPVTRSTTSALAVTDVDGDGDPDALLANAFTSNLLYLNDGTARFTDVTHRAPEETDSAFDVVTGDLDGDGRLDVAQAGGASVEIFLSDGASGFVDGSAGLPFGVLGTTLALGDVDGDLDLDLVVGRRLTIGTGGQLFLLLNGGNAQFTDASAQLPNVPTLPNALALGDVDGDGDLDLYVANDTGLNDALYLNAGNGTFADASGQIPANSGTPSDVALGDVDGDGDLDALLSHVGQNRLLLNNGSGTFADATGQLPADNDDTFALELVDVDGDADLDVVFASYTAPDRIATNDGTGVFTDATAALFPPGVDLGRGVVAGDFDGNGAIDLYGTGSTLLVNTGVGVFVDASFLLPSFEVGFTSFGAAFDYDVDGDVDLLLSGYPTLLTNVTRNLAAREVPRVGKPLTMQVFGAPSSFYVLGVSPTAIAFPAPPFGTAGIDLSAAFLAGGFTDASGRDERTVPIAANPNLVGVTLFWQALVGSSFTNVEATTFTDL